METTKPFHGWRRLGSRRSHASARRLSITGGGPEGNEQLTAGVSVVLLVTLAVLGVTILRIQQLISVHLFVGLLLLGPLALKVASTGYRFVRYYTRTASYREKGPPESPLRAIAPVVVLSTVVVFVSGVVLLFLGPSHRGSWISIHKVSFIVWLVLHRLSRPWTPEAAAASATSRRF